MYSLIAFVNEYIQQKFIFEINLMKLAFQASTGFILNIAMLI